MAKAGRNEPCPCGSGKKYKKCCLPADEQAERAAFAAREAARPRTADAFFIDEEEEFALELAAASNAVVRMVKAGQLDEAEDAAHELLQRFPSAHDGYDRLAMIYKARGDAHKAAEYHRRALACIRENAEDYGPEFEDIYLKLIESVEPPDAAQPPTENPTLKG